MKYPNELFNQSLNILICVGGMLTNLNGLFYWGSSVNHNKTGHIELEMVNPWKQSNPACACMSGNWRMFLLCSFMSIGMSSSTDSAKQAVFVPVSVLFIRLVIRGFCERHSLHLRPLIEPENYCVMKHSQKSQTEFVVVSALRMSLTKLSLEHCPFEWSVVVWKSTLWVQEGPGVPQSPQWGNR